MLVGFCFQIWVKGGLADIPELREIRPSASDRRGVQRRCFRSLLMGLILAPWFFHSSAFAESSVSDNPDASSAPVFRVSEVQVHGDNPLSAAATRKILAPYRNRELTVNNLREAASEIDRALAVKGYNFYTAIVPPQELKDDVVQLQVVHLDIGDVAVIGNEFFSANNVQKSLPLIAKGRSPNTIKIASAILLAEDNPAKDVRVLFVKGKDPQTVNANITVTDQNPNELFLWANNAGSDLTTKSRLGLQYHNRNLWGRDHQLALSYTVSPEDTGELNQYGVNYRVPFYRLQGMANIFYSKSDVNTGRVADVFDVSGAGETTGIGYTQYLQVHGTYQHRLKLGIIDKLFDNEILFESTNIGNDVRSRPLTLAYVSRLGRDNWLMNFTVSHSANLSGGAFNDDQSYALSRVGGLSDWDKQNLSFRYDYRWNKDWRGRALLYAQSSSDALIAGEKFGLGGALGNFGPRGFLEREVMVDKGYKASFELSRNFDSRKMQFGAFYDYATGKQNNPQAGEAAEETLVSVGLVFKWNVRPDVSLKLDYGYVLDGVDQTFSSGTDDSDSRLHVSLSYFPRWPWGGSK